MTTEPSTQRISDILDTAAVPNKRNLKKEVAHTNNLIMLSACMSQDLGTYPETALAIRVTKKLAKRPFLRYVLAWFLTVAIRSNRRHRRLRGARRRRGSNKRTSHWHVLRWCTQGRAADAEVQHHSGGAKAARACTGIANRGGSRAHGCSSSETFRSWQRTFVEPLTSTGEAASCWCRRPLGEARHDEGSLAGGCLGLTCRARLLA